MLWLAPNNMQTILFFSKTQWNVCACGIGRASIVLFAQCKTKVWKVQLQTLMNLTSFKLFLMRSNSRGRSMTHARRECDKGLSWEDCCWGELLSSPKCVCPGRIDLWWPGCKLQIQCHTNLSTTKNENDQWVKGAINSPHQIRWLQRHDHLQEE